MVYDQVEDGRIIPAGLKFKSFAQAFDGRLFQQLFRINQHSEFFSTFI
jgi:hypothetical protein